MNIVDCLKSNDKIQICNGDKHLYYDKIQNMFIVYIERKYCLNPHKILIETEHENEAINEFMTEEPISYGGR